MIETKMTVDFEYYSQVFKQLVDYKYYLVDGEEDHVPVLYPYERQAYILVRNPGGHSTSNGNSGSRGDGSKGGNSAVSTVPSDDSKGSYVSNGSASGGNGYVMGILQQRRHNIAEPL